MSTILAGTGSSGFHSIVHQSSTAADSVTRPNSFPSSAWTIGGGLAIGAALFGVYYFRRLWMPSSCRACQIKCKSASHVALATPALPTGDIYNYASWDVYGDLSKVKFGAEARQSLFTFLPALKSAGESGAAADSILLLNHGSYGAVPAPVQQSLHSLLRHVENCPDLWFRFNGFKVMRKAIEDIAPFVGADAEDLVFVPNATTGVNSVVRSMFPKFQKGDAIITMSLNYAAVNNTLLYSQEQTPVRLLSVEIPLPVSGPEQIVKLVADFMEKHHTDNPVDGNPRSRIRLAVIDHITSATAMILPVKELTELFHKYRVLVCVDAAHAIGQIPVNLKDLGVDFYTTNCHKWLFTPKGCALLYTRREHQEWVHPVVTSHEFRNGYIHRFYQQGTRDETQFAAAAAALKFYKAVGGDRIRAHNNALAREGAEYLAKHFGTTRANGSAVCPWSMHGSMAVIELPIDDPTNNAILTHSPLSAEIMAKLLQQERCVGVITSYKGRLYTRVSANIYNSIEEYKLLATLLDKLFDQMNLKRRV